MTKNPEYIYGITNIENELYNEIIPMWETVLTTDAQRRTMEGFKVQAIGNYMNDKSSRHYSILQDFVKSKLLHRDVLDYCLVIELKRNTYVDFIKNFMMSASQKIKDIDMTQSFAVATVLTNPRTKKKICIVLIQDINEVLRMSNGKVGLHQDIPMDITVQSAILHELIHIQQFVFNNKQLRSPSTYHNWRELEAYAIQFEWIDQKMKKNIMLELLGTRSYHVAAEKYVNRAIGR